MAISEKLFSSKAFLERLCNRDKEAVTEVVQAYTRQLHRAALGLGFDVTGSDELVQRVWATFFDVLPNFRGDSSVRTFLFGILYNKASELRREHAKFDSPDPIDEVMEKRFSSQGTWAVPPINPEQFLLATEAVGHVEDCLKGLSTVQKTAFLLREVEQLDGSEVCNVLQLKATHLRVVLFRARNSLRECLERKAQGEKRKGR
ncbi:MAG: RNA polymerase sigma factor [Deltaproteobacteria bacterium]|nr:RNA polymerase sigma factor [Deltaproteobacteria bacterium]